MAKGAVNADHSLERPLIAKHRNGLCQDGASKGGAPHNLSFLLALEHESGYRRPESPSALQFVNATALIVTYLPSGNGDKSRIHLKRRTAAVGNGDAVVGLLHNGINEQLVDSRPAHRGHGKVFRVRFISELSSLDEIESIVYKYF